MNNGSFISGEDGYDEYLTDTDPGADNCASSDNGRKETIIKIQKRTGSLKFILLTDTMTRFV
jgi:hypothetical protein